VKPQRALVGADARTTSRTLQHRPALQGERQTEFVGRVLADHRADLHFLLGLGKPSRTGGWASGRVAVWP
jgi:hypothetical protein